MLEAKCTKCEETFNPDDVNDVIHLMREDGKFCGGLGHIQGEYKLPTAPLQGPPPDYDAMEAQAAYDDLWGR